MKIAARDIMTDVVRQSDLLVEVKGDYKRKLMDTLLEIMQSIHDVCVKHGIRYSLCGGSALGAVRHQGFIPWDDDLDICMPREDLERFKKLFESELGDCYILDVPNYLNRESKCTFGKVYKKNTELWEVQDACEKLPYPRGIYVDLCVAENMSNNKLIRKIDAVISDFMKGIATSMVYYKYNNPILERYYSTTPESKRYFKIRKALGVIQYIVPHKMWVNMFDRFVSRHKNESESVTIPVGRKYYNGEIHSRSLWTPLVLTPFEGHHFYIFNNAVEYLSNLYGPNYMQLPPENKRERHFCVKLDFGDGTTPLEANFDL